MWETHSSEGSLGYMPDVRQAVRHSQNPPYSRGAPGSGGAVEGQFSGYIYMVLKKLQLRRSQISHMKAQLDPQHSSCSLRRFGVPGCFCGRSLLMVQTRRVPCACLQLEKSPSSPQSQLPSRQCITLPPRPAENPEMASLARSHRPDVC